jgi:hypothetical protein
MMKITVRALLHSGFLHGLFVDSKNRSDVPPKCQLTADGLRGVIPQKIELFITTSVRTSNCIQVF